MRALSLPTTAAVLLLLACAPASALSGADGCGTRDVRTLVAGVPALAKEAPTADGATARAATLANGDDPRIAATVRLAAVPAEAPVTRAEYVRGVRASLDAAGASEPGQAVETSVNPYDPVSWGVVAHRDGEVPSTTGEDVVRLSPTCRLVVDWQAPDAPVLRQRVIRFGQALGALRDAAARLAEPSDFLGDAYAPTGASAVGLGLVLPLALSALVAALSLRLAEGRAAPSTSRAAAVACAAAAGAALALQSGAYLSSFDDLRYAGGAVLLAVAGGLCVAGAAGRSRTPLAAGLTTAVTCGYSLLVACYLDWVPSRAVSGGAAVVLCLAGATGLWAWFAAGGAARAARAAAPLGDAKA